MSFYARHVLPRLTDLVMRSKAAVTERAKLVPEASGTVLEIGIGSALNLPFYGADVTRLYGVDPSRELWRIGRRRVERARFPVHFLQGSAERLPLEDEAVDTVVSTWSLCTVPDAGRAMSEIRRVLKPAGRFVFIEHGRAPEPRVRAWQDRLTPLWKRVAGGCHMNQPIAEVIAGGGLRILRMDRGYVNGPKVLTYLFRGVAIPATDEGTVSPSAAPT